MTTELRRLLAWLSVGLVLFGFGLPAMAQDSEAEPEEPVAEIDEVVVVTASRTEQKLHDVPASITVLTSEQVETMPADDYGDILRNVPGLNVSQIGTRDVNVSARQASGSLTTGQLVLIDGRTLYLDFFGFVIWEYLPVNTAEVKQIEVVQGPGSSVWGANAMQGVINVITKSPQEMEGTYLQLGGGELSTLYGGVTHATAGERGGFKISTSYYQQDEPYDRPTGTIPGTGTPYPDFANSGTEQPKIDLRYDTNPTDDTTLSFSGGWAATDGLMHTGIGPFDIDNSSNLTYVKGSWSKLALSVTAFANLLDGDAANLLTTDPTGQPLQLGFQSETYNIDVVNSNVLGSKNNNIITYGVNYRQNEYDLSIAPAGQDRTEWGVFVNDEILIGDKFRWVIGARYDDIDPVGEVVSPRTTLMYSPTPDHTFRVSYNQAYRAPSLIENHLDIDIISASFPTRTVYDLGVAPLLPFPLPCEFVLSTCDDQILLTAALGNPDLKEEQLEAYEIGYVGTYDRATFTFAAYRNELSDATDFFDSEFYNPFNLPASWPRFLFPLGPTIPAGAPLFTDILTTVPSVFTYRNIGEKINQGIELSLEVRPNRNTRISANYTWQDRTEVTGIDPDAVNQPPENTLNLGVFYDADRWYVNGNLNYVDEAFWTDVLDERFHGPTDDFTQVNLGIGYRFLEDRAVFTIMASNLFDEDVQQHVFGDIISRKVTAELRFNF